MEAVGYREAKERETDLGTIIFNMIHGQYQRPVRVGGDCPYDTGPQARNFVRKLSADQVAGLESSFLDARAAQHCP